MSQEEINNKEKCIKLTGPGEVSLAARGCSSAGNHESELRCGIINSRIKQCTEK